MSIPLIGEVGNKDSESGMDPLLTFRSQVGKADIGTQFLQGRVFIEQECFSAVVQA